MTYNGWRNYATWCAYIWLSSYDDGVMASFAGMDAEALRDAWTRGVIGDTPARDAFEGWARDVLGTAIRDVDWHAIAEAIAEGNE